ncbi:hypothetical protein Zmor_027514 [Zophobas morio]|uniref:Uncharacterized protein n=1 Tax=Zophobas morio TaxID=2755281 RepID=A0AA38HND2_9CUCU|nr:hypothetical protein Zmor_027514 [Zophobas morio]
MIRNSSCVLNGDLLIDVPSVEDIRGNPKIHDAGPKTNISYRKDDSRARSLDYLFPDGFIIFMSVLFSINPKETGIDVKESGTPPVSAGGDQLIVCCGRDYVVGAAWVSCLVTTW